MDSFIGEWGLAWMGRHWSGFQWPATPTFNYWQIALATRPMIRESCSLCPYVVGFSLNLSLMGAAPQATNNQWRTRPDPIRPDPHFGCTGDQHWKHLPGKDENRPDQAAKFIPTWPERQSFLLGQYIRVLEDRNRPGLVLCFRTPVLKLGLNFILDSRLTKWKRNAESFFNTKLIFGRSRPQQKAMFSNSRCDFPNFLSEKTGKSIRWFLLSVLQNNCCRNKLLKNKINIWIPLLCGPHSLPVIFKALIKCRGKVCLPQEVSSCSPSCRNKQSSHAAFVCLWRMSLCVLPFTMQSLPRAGLGEITKPKVSCHWSFHGCQKAQKQGTCRTTVLTSRNMTFALQPLFH